MYAKTRIIAVEGGLEDKADGADKDKMKGRRENLKDVKNAKNVEGVGGGADKMRY